MPNSGNSHESPRPALRRLWLRWTEPARGVVDAGERRTVRLLATLLLVLVPLGLTSAVAQLLRVEGYTRTFFVIIGALLVLGGTYWLSRTVHYRIAATVASLVPVVAGGIVGLTSPDDPVWFAFMGLGPVLASALFTSRHVGVFGGVAVTATAIVLLVSGKFTGPGDGIPPLAFVLILSVLIVTLTWHRSEVEQARRSEIRESQSLYRNLFDHAPVGIGVATLDGRVVAFNDAMVRQGGYTREAMARLTNVSELYYDAETRAALLARLRREGRVLASDVRLRGQDGTPYDAALSLEPITFEGQACILAISEDISERKRAEAERSDLSDIIDRSLNEVYLFDTDTLRFQYANEGARRNIGYSMEQLRQLTPVDLKPDFNTAAFRALIDPLLRGETELLVFEARHRRADGTLYPAEVRLQLARRSGRRVFLAVVLDITARTQAEREKELLSLQLIAQEQRFSSMIEHSTDIVALLGSDAALQYLNPAFETILGYRVADWLGKSMLDLIWPEDLPATEALFARSLAAPGEVLRWQLRIRHADGTFRWVEGSGTNHLDDPATRGMVINCRDVTERRQAEEAVRQNELRLRVAYDTSDLAVFEMDSDLRYTWMYSPQRGYSPEQTIGRTDFELVGDDGLRVMDLKRRVLESGHGIREEVRIRWAGAESWFALTLEPILSETRAVVGVRGASLDISEAKALRGQFLQAQKMETLGRLAGGVAHDFNNLLTVINGTASLAAMGLGKHDPLQSGLEEIRRAGERAAVLTRQLLAFSRKQILQPVVVNLDAAVADVTTMLRRLIGEDIDLTIVHADGAANVKADPGQIEQVIVNLAVNARDAMPNGGSLTIETQSVSMDEDQARRLSVLPGPYLRLAVSDTGAGMDEATRERIFEPFFTTKAAGQGSGLGLATVYGIVRQSGGSVSVRSEVGMGSTFEIYLPRVEGVVQSERPARNTTLTRGTETILIVEDDKPIRDLTERLFILTGYRVLAAASGMEAIALLEGHDGQVDLLVTDVLMPGMSGPELVARLAASDQRMKVLYVSGFAADALQVIDEGAHFIGKPYSITDLTRKVREVLDAPAT